jgi:RHS repeat-associated protein
MSPFKILQKALKQFLPICLFSFWLTLSGGESWCEVSHQEAIFFRAQSLWEQNKWEDAVLAYEEYLNKNPEGVYAAEAHMNLGQYLEGYDRLEEALEFYQEGLNRAKGKIAEVLQTEIAAVNAKMGNLDQAIEIYQRLMRETKEWDIFKASNRDLKDLVRFKAAIGKNTKSSRQCGQDSLLAIFRHYGVTPSEKILAEKLKEDKQGISLSSMVEAAKAHGLKSYGVIVKDKNIAAIQPPAILHLRPGHYVVFKERLKEQVRIIDPLYQGQKETNISFERLKKMWTGHALVFNRADITKEGVIVLTRKEMDDLFGGHDWWHTGSWSKLGGSDDNPKQVFDDPPGIFVNTSTFNLVITDTDGIWKGMGGNVVLKRTYNADDSTSGMFGHSWHFQYEVFIKANPDNTVSLFRGSGKWDIYTSQGSGAYTPPGGVYDKLQKKQDGTYSLLIKNTRETFIFNASGYLTSIVDKNGNKIEVLWNQDHRLTKIIVYYGSSLTKETSFQYNTSGQCNKIVLPDGRYASFEYNQGKLIKSIDMAGYQTTYQYDQYNFIKSITTSVGTSQIIYQNLGSGIYAPQKIIDPMGNERIYSTDGYWVVVKNARGYSSKYLCETNFAFTTNIVGANGGETKFTYDSYGNRTSVTDPSGQKWIMSYDPGPSRGDLTKVTDPMGNSVIMAYDSNDNLISIDAPLGRHTAFQYDAKWNVVKVINALSKEVNLTYNSLGKLTKIQLPGNPKPEINFNYDTCGNLLSETDPEGHPTQFTYDNAGRVISRTDAKSNFVQFEYDALDKLTRVSYPDGNVIYEYDCCSLKRVKAKDGREMTFQYNADSRLTRFQDLNGFVIQYGYDGVGNLASLTYPGNKVVTYEYDNVDRLSAVTDWLANRTGYTYDILGNVVKMLYPNGTSTKFYYDKNQRLIVLENFGLPGQSLPQFAYKLDALGNRIGETRRNMNFYEPQVQNVPYSYDPADRILSAGSTTFQHDNNGNLIKKILPSGVTNYTYDYNDMLIGFQTPSENYQYEYDPLLNRISKQRGSEESFFVVDPNHILPQVLMHTNAAGTPTGYYVYGLGLVSRIDPSGSVYYYHYDGLGSTVAITNSSGAVVNHYSYDPFGKLLNSQESFENPFRYVGRFGVMDEGNELLYMRARYYDSEVGRFINKDPIRLAGGLNPYNYALQNPITLIDPVGLHAERGTSKGEVTLDKLLKYAVSQTFGYSVLWGSAGAALGFGISWYTGLGAAPLTFGGFVLGSTVGAIIGINEGIDMLQKAMNQRRPDILDTPRFKNILGLMENQ